MSFANNCPPALPEDSYLRMFRCSVVAAVIIAAIVTGAVACRIQKRKITAADQPEKTEQLAVAETTAAL